MALVILRMDVHCYGCAGRIRKAVKNLLGTCTSPAVLHWLAPAGRRRFS